MENQKSISIKIDESLHKKIKIRIAEIGKTQKDYMLELIEKDLKGQ